MQELSHEQDILTKQLAEAEVQSKHKNYAERNYINLSLIIWEVLFGLIVILTTLINKGLPGNPSKENILVLITFMILAIVTQSLAYFNKSIGFFLISIVAFTADIYITHLTPTHYSEFTTLIDGAVIFSITNQYFKKGFIISSIGIILKIVFFTIILSNSGVLIVYLISSIINSLSLGLVPYLLHLQQENSRALKSQKIRAEILSIQNQDLLRSWQEYFEKPQKSNEVTVTQNDTGTSQYISSYGTVSG